MRLRDGTVIPHYMGVRDTSGPQGPGSFFGEVGVMVGEVTEVFYPDDKGNVSGKFMEYTVLVWRRQGAGAFERIAYHCMQADGFGSLADFFRFVLRSASSTPTPLANGATVFIACVNGDRSNSYVLAGVPQPNRKEGDPMRADGRAMRGRFNGVELAVNDDGSFELKVPGATTVDGAPDPARDENNHGSLVRFDANGDITIDDQNGESVVVNPGEKSITVVAEKKLNESAEAVSITASKGLAEKGESVSITAADGLTEKADTVAVSAGKSWKLKAPKVVVESSDVNLGGDGLDPIQHGVVQGMCIDMLTGVPFGILKNTSLTVKAKQ